MGDPLIGRTVDRHELVALLGAGGMGAVYATRDPAIAIKAIDPILTRDREIAKRFLREARLASQLSHPSIVRVFGFGQTDDAILYIVMERVHGRTLADVLLHDHRFAVDRTIHVALQLCEALAVAHGLGIVHRDLKPANVMLLDGDLVKVLDFGLAKSLTSPQMSLVSASNARLGTPLYMSPEQIQGRAVDARTDLYALGCVLHEMLSGGAPFAGNTVDRILSNHMYELSSPLPGDVPEPLGELVRKLIAKHPDERPPSALAVRDALRAR
jgi:serine/threonine-protein kinase